MIVPVLLLSSCPTVSTNVSVVDVSAPSERGSRPAFEASEQMALPFEFPPTEDVGQLYSYRLNSRAAVLGTRRWQPFRGQNVTIGVQQTGSGMYVCLATNANERSIQTVTIAVQGTDIHCSCVCRSLHNKINSPIKNIDRSMETSVITFLFQPLTYQKPLLIFGSPQQLWVRHYSFYSYS